MQSNNNPHLHRNASPDIGTQDYPPAILDAHGHLRGLAIPDEAVVEVARRLAGQPQDDFVARTRHLVGPLDVVVQEAASSTDTSEPTAVQSFALWKRVDRSRALALAHIIAEILFFTGHTGVAVALVDCRGKGLVFRMTTLDADFVSREIVGCLSSGDLQ